MRSQPSIMTHDFSKIQGNQIERSQFVRPYSHGTTIDAGQLVPVLVDEILPGDVLNIRSTAVGRILSFLYPLMDNLTLSLFWFFTPCRLLWSNWEKFMGARDNPGDSIDFLVPTIDTSGGWTPVEGSIADYFGLPIVQFALTERVNALPFRAYNLIWNEWFRDTQLQDSLTVQLTDGPDNPALYAFGGIPKRRGKRHDYFTSCRTAPQLGDAVALPLGTVAPVYGTGEVLGLWDGTNFAGAYGGGFPVAAEQSAYNTAVGAAVVPATPLTVNVGVGVTTDPAASGMVADLTGATAATINQLREAFALQQIRELDSRGGTRYVEQLKQVFGVISPDFRLQRPEYLGGTRERVGLRATAQSTANPAVPTLADNKGSMAATGEVIANSSINYSAVEHGYLMCLACIDADLTYQYGLRKMWSRSTRFDFYRPETAHLGEQAVLNKEIFYAANGVGVNGVFGYQERWDEMRYFPSLKTGKFRSNATGTLHAWHLSELETAIPTLDDTWIQSDPPLDRAIAVPSEPHMMFDLYCDIRHTRPIPVYSTPGMRRL